MRKGEMEKMQIGDKIQSKRDERVYTVTEINDKGVMVDGYKKYTWSTLKRNFIPYEEVEEPVVEVEPQNEEMLIDDIVAAVENGDDSVLVKPVVEEVVEPEVNPTVEVITGQPIVTELKPKATRKVEEKLNNNTVTLVDILDVADEFKLGHKTNKTHIVLKAKKNIMEVYYSSKKHTCYVVIKHQCVDAVPNIKEELIMNYEGKIVGAGTYTLDFKFRVDTVDQLKQAISLAVNY